MMIVGATAVELRLVFVILVSIRTLLCSRIHPITVIPVS